ncbi:MAG: hypothetical protein E2O56_03510 [Gammaproteobacteria bacterium]|nr:MAG: hypothetical protein E2O56_03510 [Gammaproteobacteria bacterium]
MDENELKALRWRCRRGMQELDILLSRFLERDFADQAEPVQEAFRGLLDSEDDVLWDWLSGRAQPDDEELRDVVRRVRQTVAD